MSTHTTMSRSEIEQLRLVINQELEFCIHLLASSTENIEQVITKLDSVISALDSLADISIFSRLRQLIEQSIHILEGQIDNFNGQGVGRPKQHISVSTLEHLLAMNFRVTQIAEMYGVSSKTIFRRLKEAGLSVVH